jgi:hypothetical protein
MVYLFLHVYKYRQWSTYASMFINTVNGLLMPPCLQMPSMIDLCLHVNKYRQWPTYASLFTNTVNGWSNYAFMFTNPPMVYLCLNLHIYKYRQWSTYASMFTNIINGRLMPPGLQISTTVNGLLMSPCLQIPSIVDLCLPVYKYH